MNKDQAAQLAADIVDTWPLSPKARIWLEALVPMDYEHARRAYIQLRRNRHERDLSIGLFTDEYRRLKPPTPRPEHVCDVCGDGWITVDYTANGRPYRGAIPCTCPTGIANEPIWNTIRKSTTEAA